MRQIIIVFLMILTIVFISLISLNESNKNNDEELINRLNNNNVIVKSNFDGYYVVEINDEIVVLNNSYDEIKREKINNLLNYEKFNYLIYKNDMLMYETTTKNDNVLIYKYYDAYTNKLLSSVEIGG